MQPVPVTRGMSALPPFIYQPRSPSVTMSSAPVRSTVQPMAEASAFAVFRRRADPHFFRRRISGETVSQAATIMMMYLVLFLGGGLVISRLEGLPVLTSLFETASAIGTVGLSLGVTPQEFFDEGNACPVRLRELMDEAKRLDDNALGHLLALMRELNAGR